LSAPCYSLRRHNTLLRKKEPSKNFSKILGDGASNYLLRTLEGFSSTLEEEKALECNLRPTSFRPPKKFNSEKQTKQFKEKGDWKKIGVSVR
jgi:hypothetical protein